MAIRELVQSDRGVATSLLETVLVIAIVSIIASVAMVSAVDHLESAKLSRATADAEMIGIAIHSFMLDNGFAPAFKSGDERGPQAEIFRVLETGGSEPVPSLDSLGWPTASEDRDLLANHLVKNQPGGAGTRYRRVGEGSNLRFKGWNGPYLASIPTSDPWNNKYLVNVQLLTPKGAGMAAGSLVLPDGMRAAVIVLSSGPNRMLETRFDQIADTFVAGGDDVIFRIQ